MMEDGRGKKMKKNLALVIPKVVYSYLHTKQISTPKIKIFAHLLVQVFLKII